MKRIGLDKPWKRPGRAGYARNRTKAFLRPPITVYEMPSDVRKDEDLSARMRDGVTLRLNLYRPAGTDEPLPVLLSAHPYGKDAIPTKKRGRWSLNPQFRIMNQPAPLRISDQTSWEAPDPVWWAQHGYAVINLDTRGGGHSEGRGNLFSDQEADDIAEVIAWAGEQPWSNGRVGMLGVSYLALSQYKVAALNPPALRAICPWEGFTDAYRDFFTSGGVVENGFARIWLFLSSRVARLDTNLAAERRRHPLRDEWWEAITPDLSRITVPILVCTSFSDTNLHSVGSMRAFQQVASVHRHASTHRGPKWATFYDDPAREQQRAFFDLHLREKPAAQLPRLRLEIRDRRDLVVEVRDEQEWPIARTRWRDLYLGADGALSETEPLAGAVTFDLKHNAARIRLPLQRGHRTERSNDAAAADEDDGRERSANLRRGRKAVPRHTRALRGLLRLRPRHRRARQAQARPPRTRRRTQQAASARAHVPDAPADSRRRGGRGAHRVESLSDTLPCG